MRVSDALVGTALVGFLVALFLLVVAFFVIYPALLEPDGRAALLCQKAGFLPETSEFGRCLDQRLNDSMWTMALPWSLMSVTVASGTLIVVTFRAWRLRRESLD
jgi:hypothetical protein